MFCMNTLKNYGKPTMIMQVRTNTEIKDRND